MYVQGNEDLSVYELGLVLFKDEVIFYDAQLQFKKIICTIIKFKCCYEVGHCFFSFSFDFCVWMYLCLL